MRKHTKTGCGSPCSKGPSCTRCCPPKPPSPPPCPCASVVNDALVRSVVNALDTNNVAAFAAFLAPDVVTQFDAEPPIVGRDARIQSLTEFTEAGGSADFDIQNILITQRATPGGGCEILATVFSFTTIMIGGFTLLVFDTITFTFNADCLIRSERVHTELVSITEPETVLGAAKLGNTSAMMLRNAPTAYWKRP